MDQKAYNVVSLPDTIVIGRRTETGVLAVRFDCTAWLAYWPKLSLSLWVTPPGGSAAYPATTHMSGKELVWTVNSADTAVEGYGTLEIVGTAPGQKKLSAVAKTRVLHTTTATTAEPPEAAQNWVDQVLEAAKDAEEAVDRAEAEVTKAAAEVAKAKAYADEAKENAVGGLTWEDIAGKPSTYPPETHKHSTNDIDGLSDALAQAGKVKTVNNIAPDANGNIDLGELGGGDGTVTAVNGEAPDENGNVQLDAQKVGALSSDPNEDSGETPEMGSVPSNADQLGGLTYQQIVDMIYPIGRTITTLSDDDNPNTLYPWQVWEQTAKGRMIIGTGANEANTDETYGSLAAGTVDRTLGEMGGEAAHAITVNEMPSHKHDVKHAANAINTNGSIVQRGYQAESSIGLQNTETTGGDQPHNNMPPYIAANIWKRVS